MSPTTGRVASSRTKAGSRPCPCGEEVDRGRGVEAADVGHGLAGHTQDLPTGGEDAQLRERPEELVDDGGHGAHHVFAVVEDDEGSAPEQGTTTASTSPSDRQHGRHRPPRWHPRLRRRPTPQRRGRHTRQLDEPDRLGRLLPATAGRLRGEAGLAYAPRADERDQPGVARPGAEVGDRLLRPMNEVSWARRLSAGAEGTKATSRPTPPPSRPGSWARTMASSRCSSARARCPAPRPGGGALRCSTARRRPGGRPGRARAMRMPRAAPAADARGTGAPARRRRRRGGPGEFGFGRLPSPGGRAHRAGRGRPRRSGDPNSASGPPRRSANACAERSRPTRRRRQPAGPALGRQLLEAAMSTSASTSRYPPAPVTTAAAPTRGAAGRSASAARCRHCRAGPRPTRLPTRRSTLTDAPPWRATARAGPAVSDRAPRRRPRVPHLEFAPEGEPPPGARYRRSRPCERARRRGTVVRWTPPRSIRP